MKRLALGFSLLVVACGGSTTETTTTEPTETTSGGDVTVEAEPIVVLRSTTPIPVPQPAIPREQLSPVLQDIWTKVEEAVAIRPPETPTEHTLEAVNAWAQGPFTTWIQARTEANRAVEALSSELTNAEHPHSIPERAVGAALFGYLYEDLVSGVRGAPIPEEITNDQELLDVYVGALTNSTSPVARRALDAYLFCARHVAEYLGETPWAEWGPYCYARAEDVNAVYELVPHAEVQESPGAPGTAPDSTSEEAPEATTAPPAPQS